MLFICICLYTQEIVTVENPYRQYEKVLRGAGVLVKIAEGVTPIWPQDNDPNGLKMNKLHKDIRGLVAPLKELCMMCWEQDPKARPSMRSIRDKLDHLSVGF